MSDFKEDIPSKLYKKLNTKLRIAIGIDNLLKVKKLTTKLICLASIKEDYAYQELSDKFIIDDLYEYAINSALKCKFKTAKWLLKKAILMGHSDICEEVFNTCCELKDNKNAICIIEFLIKEKLLNDFDNDHYMDAIINKRYDIYELLYNHNAYIFDKDDLIYIKENHSESYNWMLLNGYDVYGSDERINIIADYFDSFIPTNLTNLIIRYYQRVM
jgi:hypothetical protein